MLRSFISLLTAMAFLVLVCVAPAAAAITIGGDSGEVSPADPATWTAFTYGYVGRTNGMTGTITLDGGSAISSSCSYLGYASGSSGSIDVIGSGSTFATGNSLYVGYRSLGGLSATNGGEIIGGTSYVGFLSGSSGTAAVTGADSTWTNSGPLYIGYSGSGALSVENGGVLSSGESHLGGISSDAAGTALVSGTDAAWNVYASLYVGNVGTGALSIAHGGTASSQYGYVGYEAGSSGSVMVTGPSSTWNSGPLQIGTSGEGSLTVTDGAGVVTIGDANLGMYRGSDGSVTVAGPGSDWAVAGFMRIGGYGTGSLSVEDGGTVSACTLRAASAGLEGDGAITVNGLISDKSMTFNAQSGANAALSFGTGGTLNVHLNGDGQLGVGYGGAASLTIAEGVEAKTVDGTISSGSNAVVIGGGSKWTNSGGLYVYNGGLTVADGAVVSDKSGYLGESSGIGMAVVRGAASQWINTNEFSVGWFGTGSMTVESGGSVSNTIGRIGRYGTSTGEVTVTGAGSSWTNSSDLYVGEYGNGSLTVADGGCVSGRQGFIGYNSGSAGMVVVTGMGSTWTSEQDLFVGHDGVGSLEIRDGGRVLSYRGYMGYATGAKGVGIVRGQGSTWDNTGSLNIEKNGVLIVADGGKVTAERLVIGVLDLRVNGSNMVVLGNSSTAGSVYNAGQINCYADAFIIAGTYSPITDCLGRAMTWSGTGAYNGIGGTWSSVAKKFTVAAVTNLPAGATLDSVSTGGRLLIIDAATGERVGASFGTVAGGTTFSASRLSDGDLDGLTAVPGQSMLAAWDFNTNFSGGEVLLAFDIGLGASDLQAWHYDGTTWAMFEANDLIYDAHGIASFTVTDFSGYALTGTVPEPATAALLGLGGLIVLRRRSRRARP